MNNCYIPLQNKIKTQLNFIPVDNHFKDEIKFAFTKFINDEKRMCNNPRNVALHQTLNNLAIDSDIKVGKFDKGKSVTILDTKDRYVKLNCIISDNFKFHEVDQNTKIRSFIRKKSI